MQTFCKVKNCRFPNTHVTQGHKCGNCGSLGHGQIECENPNEIANLSNHLSDTIPISLQCNIPNCYYKQFHITEGHFCYFCANYGNCICDKKNYGSSQSSLKCPICRTSNSFSSKEDLKIFGIEQKCSICMNNSVDILLPNCKHACLCSECLNIITTKSEIIDDDLSHAISIAENKIGTQNNVYTMVYSGQGCAWYIRRLNNMTTTFFLHGDNQGQYGPETNHIPLLKTFLGNCKEI